MARFERFEDIDAWQEARALVKLVYAATSRGKFARDYGLRNQIQEASVSIMSNIAEGFERGTNREFIHFLYISKGSAGEVRSKTYVALDLDYIDNATFQELFAAATSVSRRIAGLIRYLEDNPRPTEKARLMSKSSAPRPDPNSNLQTFKPVTVSTLSSTVRLVPCPRAGFPSRGVGRGWRRSGRSLLLCGPPGAAG
jgi:four helix bundle protein